MVIDIWSAFEFAWVKCSTFDSLEQAEVAGFSSITSAEFSGIAWRGSVQSWSLSLPGLFLNMLPLFYGERIIVLRALYLFLL